MNNYIDDFDRTEHSDFIQGVLGRSLVLATRFDNLCTSLSQALDIRTGFTRGGISPDEFSKWASKVASDRRILSNSIKSLGVPSNAEAVLHKARDARNEVAHSLAVGMEGCVDSRISTPEFIHRVKRIANSLATGDLVISAGLAAFNKEPEINKFLKEGYINRVVDWVVRE